MPAAARRDTESRASATRERQLEARVRELEDELHGRGGRRPGRRSRYWDETRDDVRGLGDRKVDEVARLFTGVVHAGLEGFRVAADTASFWVEDSLERNIPEPGEDSAEVASRLPADIVRASVRSVDRGLDAPRRAADRFNRVYREDEGGAQRRSWQSDTDVRDMTRGELEQQAEDFGIVDAGQLPRRELERRVRNYEPPLGDLSTVQLRRRARELEISAASNLSRDELIAAIEGREPDA